MAETISSARPSKDACHTIGEHSQEFGRDVPDGFRNDVPQCLPSTHSELETSESVLATDFKELQGYQIGHEMNTMFDVEKLQEKLATYKAHLPFGKLFFLGLLAGWWVGLAVILVETIAGGIPIATRAAWPCLPKLVAGFFFPVAIFLIVIYGGELFTGNAMTMLIGVFSKRITVSGLLYNWSVVLVSNFAGCVVTVYLFGKLTHLFEDEPWLSYCRGVAAYKIHLKPEICFLRAIPANALVCTSVLLGQQARTMPGKLVRTPSPLKPTQCTQLSSRSAAYPPSNSRG